MLFTFIFVFSLLYHVLQEISCCYLLSYLKSIVWARLNAFYFTPLLTQHHRRRCSTPPEPVARARTHIQLRWPIEADRKVGQKVGRKVGRKTRSEVSRMTGRWKRRQDDRTIGLKHGRKLEIGRLVLKRQAVVGPTGRTFKTEFTFIHSFLA